MFALFKATQLNRELRKGVAVVEFAVTLPILTLVVLGSVEATTMIFNKQSLEITAYEGARIALVPGSNAGNVEAACNQILVGRRIQEATITVVPADFDNQPYGTPIRVQVDAPSNKNCVFAPWFYSGKILTADVTMMKEF